MRNIILMLITIILIPIAVISFNKNETNFNLPKKDNIKITLKNVNNNKVTNIDLEEYVIGVVAAEMPASFHEEALKAQAVAARTYAYYKIKHTKKDYDVLNDISDQGYISKEEMKQKWLEDYELYYNKIKNAVNKTKNEVITYDNEVILAYYFAMSNGYTEDASFVFSDAPYLESVTSKWDNETLNNFKVDQIVAKDNFCRELNISCNNLVINDVTKTKSNRVHEIVINNQTFKGTDIRKKLNLRSTDFEISFTKNEVIITTNGYGHGVGMSQYGANGMAKEGKEYKEILNYYYKNTEISKI